MDRARAPKAEGPLAAELTALRSVLGHIRQSLREGRYDGLDAMLRRQQELSERLAATPTAAGALAPRERALLKRLHDDAVRTGRLLEAARAGMRAGRRRRQELLESLAGGSTYGADGRRARLLRTPARLELRR